MEHLEIVLLLYSLASSGRLLSRRTCRLVLPLELWNYATQANEYLRCTFRNYVWQIDPFPDNYFDVVLIDGRARSSCIAHSSRKVKTNGILILDDAERRWYLSNVSHYLEGFQVKEFLCVGPSIPSIWQTNVYEKF